MGGLGTLGFCRDPAHGLNDVALCSEYCTMEGNLGLHDLTL